MAKRILHVTEALGGGLEAALVDYVKSTPSFEHYVVFTRRGHFSTDDPFLTVFNGSFDAGVGVRALALKLGAAIREFNPDLIHLHSAWAGLIGRTMRTHSMPVAYSPHSYYFEREDLTRAVRFAARMIERMFAKRADAVGALTPYEVELARRLGSEAVYIPNIVRLPSGVKWRGSKLAGGGNEILLVGRLAGQKDPAFAIDVKRVVDESQLAVQWIWVGDGDPLLKRRLIDAGFMVTGWIPRGEVIDRMARTSLYLHVAAWEGSPITLLEAEALGVPSIARSIPALVSLGYSASLITPAEVGSAILRMASDATRREPRNNIRSVDSGAEQRAALEMLYATASRHKEDAL